MNRKLLPILIGAIVVIGVVIALIFGRGLFTEEAPAAPAPVAGTVTADVPTPTPIPTPPPDLSAEQTYSYYLAPALEQFSTWRAGPVAERSTGLETKIQDAGALNNLTYGQLLVIYMKAQASGRSDAGMDWVVQETIAPKMQPIYEQIMAEGTALSELLTTTSAPADVASAHDKLLQCVTVEVARAQTIVDVLIGNATGSVPEERIDPCTGIEAEVEALNAFVAAHPAQ